MDQAISRQRARGYALGGFLAAAALPVLAWHDIASAIAADFRWEWQYLLTGWTGFILIALGLVLFLPVLLSVGRDPESRLYPLHRNVYAAWGVTLYLLGLALSTQVEQIFNAFGL